MYKVISFFDSESLGLSDKVDYIGLKFYNFINPHNLETTFHSNLAGKYTVYSQFIKIN